MSLKCSQPALYPALRLCARKAAGNRVLTHTLPFLTDLKPIFCPHVSFLVSRVEWLCRGPPPRTPCGGEHAHVSTHTVTLGQGTCGILEPARARSPRGRSSRA